MAGSATARGRFVDGLKPCTKCERGLPPESYYKDKWHPSGRMTRCIDCRKAETQTRRWKDTQRRYKHRTRDVNREYQAEHYLNVRRRRHLVALYGVTVEQYDEMERRQGGVCAICARPPADNRRLAVDHDHGTGAVRGLLCTACNAGVGLLGDSADRLLSAASYLERSTGNGRERN